MTVRKGLRLLCLALSLLCLSGGFILTALWWEAGLVLLPVLGLAVAGRSAAARLPLACLAGLVFLAAVGLLAGAPAALMIPGAAAALAAWDLSNLESLMSGATTPATGSRFEKQHLVYLTLALALGLLLAASGSLLALDIPFVLMLALAGFDLFCLERAHRYLANRGARR